jgi:hypothetical protein
MFDAMSRKAIAGIAKRMGVEPSALLAVAEIESAGQPFARVNGKPMPLIRWEGHYFYRLLPPNLRQKGVEAGLAHPSAGKIPNPASQEARYAMLERARKIDEEAALSSCSWGLGQVMGAHWKNLGFGSVQQFVKTACSGITGQTELMARFIQRNGLTGHLKQRNWSSFARAYNGPAYKTNRYDQRMARAYVRYLSGKPPPGILAPVVTDYAPPALQEVLKPQEETYFLKPGATGPAVKELQEALKRQGIFVYTDGHYGPTTEKAVKEFQRKNGIAPDGRIGSETRAKLTTAQTDAIAPWWSKRGGSGGAAIGGGGGIQKAAAPPKTAPKQWWEPHAEALPQPTGKKLWWDV